MRTALAAAAAAVVMLTLTGCGGSNPQAPSAVTAPPPASSAAAPAASPTSQGAAFCAQLSAAADPHPVYLNAVIDQDSLISGFSTASPADVEQAARAQVAAWIAVYCPQFAYLTRDG